MNIPQVNAPAGAPPPNQPAATVAQATPFNNAMNPNGSYNSARSGIAGLTIPLNKPMVGGTGPVGLGIPAG